MTVYRTLGGAFFRIKNIFLTELVMHYKNKIKLVSAFGAGFLFLSLWHCKTTTGPAASAELSVSLRADSMAVAPAEPIVLTATVSNTGGGISSETVLRWYRSADGSVDTNTGTLLTTDAVTNLEGGTSIAFPYTDTNSKTVGMTNIYFACVDEVSGESDPSNNCSALVSVAVVSAPDLNLTLSTSTGTVNLNEPFSLSVVISNTGDLDAPQSTLRWYRSEDNSLDTNTDTNFGTETVRMLNAGESETKTRSDNVSESGYYYYFACVDPVEREIDTADNCSPAVEVAVVVPSLTVALSASSSTAPPSQEITLTALISNAGGGDSDATTLRWYRSADNSLDKNTDTRLSETATVPILAPGASHSISNSITVPETAGSHYYFACVDPVENEGDLTDDCSDAAEVVVVIPNLRVSLSASSDRVLSAVSTTLTAVVSNAGDGASAQTTTLRWYRSVDSTLDTNADTNLGTNAVPMLAVGASHSIPIPITSPETAGLHYYFACVDPVENEGDSNDNCSDVAEIEVVIPNLRVSSLSASSVSVLPTESTTLMAVVTNAGDGASGQATLRWYRSADNALDTNTDTEIGMSTLSRLAAGASTTISKPITASDVSGTYYYFACVDGVRYEVATADNCSTARAVEVRTAADLVVTLRPDKLAALPSESVIFTAIINNAGTEGAASTTLRWYRSADTNLDKSSDTLLASNTVTSLGAGASITLSNTITTASTSSTNTYFACVDQVSNEVDPADNCSSILLPAVPSGTYLPSLDFSRSALAAAGNANPWGMWSDGTNMWVADFVGQRSKLYAYDLATKARNSSEDFNTLSEPQGIFSLMASGQTAPTCGSSDTTWMTTEDLRLQDV